MLGAYVIGNTLVAIVCAGDASHCAIFPKRSNRSSRVSQIESEERVLASESVLPIEEVCAQIKKCGYAALQNVRIFGEDFEVLSDPFPNEIGIAIRVRSRRTSQVRHLQLPATLIHRVASSQRRSSV